MSGRAILSRPRTRIYDANYNIGENYYRPALDRLDRKYSGRPLSPPRRSSLPRDLLDRHDRVFGDEDLSSSRLRAEKRITENHLFDSRGARIVQRASDFIGNDINQETSSTLNRIRANKKVSVVDDVDLESTVNNINSRRLVDRSDKILKSYGLDEEGRRNLDEDIIVKRRALKVTYKADEGGDLTRWSHLNNRDDARAEKEEFSAAAIRAKQSRQKLKDIEDDMADVAERQQARERRAARLKALVAESAEETEAAQSAIQAVSIRSRRERRVENEED